MLALGWLFYAVLFSAIVFFLFPLEKYGGTIGFMITMAFFLLGGVDIFASMFFRTRKGNIW